MKKRRRLLAVGAVVLMFAGLIYSWSVLSAPLYAFGWSETSLTFNYTLTIIMFSAGGLLSGFLARRFSVRMRLIPSALALTAGIWLSSLLQPGDSILKLYVAYGTLAGLAVGVVFNTTVTSMNLWFPDHEGLASGLLLACFGMGSFFISLVCGRLISDGIMAWRAVYRLLGVVAGAIILGGAAVLRTPPQDAVFPAPADKSHTISSHSFTPHEMMATSAFLLMFVAFPIGASVGASAISLSRNLLMSVSMQEKTAIFCASFISIMNGLGRMTAGELVDRLGIKRSMTICFLLCTLGGALLLAGAVAVSPLLSAVGIFVCGFSYGFPTTLASTSSLEFYGPDNYSLNYGIFNFNSVICAVIPTVFSWISEAGGSYRYGLVYLTFNGLLALTLSLFVHRPVYRGHSKPTAAKA